MMRWKQLMISLFLLVFMFFLVSCDFVITFGQQETTTTTNTNLPTLVNGTITFEDDEYSHLGVFSSPTYSLTDIDEYNDVLLATQEHIRHTNIEVYTSLTEERYTFPWSDNSSTYQVASSTGSGFVFMEDDIYYYAITNYHVIDPDEYTATYNIMAYGDSIYYEAELVAGDKNLDLAVLRFEKLGRDEVEIMDIYTRLYYKFNPGEMVLAVGNPLELVNNVTFGEFISMEEIENVDYRVIYHNAAIHEGSSGGALVDVDGHLIGVNTWGVDATESYSFSIPNYIVYLFLINYGVIES